MSHTAVQPAVPSAEESPEESTWQESRLRRPSVIAGLAGDAAGVWLGLLVTALGFAAIVMTWVKVAGMVSVALQMPYLVSGGFAGLGLVVTGMALVDISVRRRDSLERRAQLDELRGILAELRAGLGADD